MCIFTFILWSCVGVFLGNCLWSVLAFPIFLPIVLKSENGLCDAMSMWYERYAFTIIEALYPVCLFVGITNTVF